VGPGQGRIKWESVPRDERKEQKGWKQDFYKSCLALRWKEGFRAALSSKQCLSESIWGVGEYSIYL
jgi:hypothetical protein